MFKVSGVSVQHCRWPRKRPISSKKKLWLCEVCKKRISNTEHGISNVEGMYSVLFSQKRLI